MLQIYNSKCFRSLRGMLQALYIDVVKLDWDVAHVVKAINVCFKCISQMFYLFPDECCKRFYLDVGKVDLDVAYTCMLQTYVSSVIRCFIHIFASVSSGCCICL